MKILYLHQYFNTPRMPGSTRSYEIAKRLVAKGHSVSMITTERDSYKSASNNWFISNESGIEVHWLTLPYSNNMSYLKRFVAFIKYIFLSISYVKNIDADVVFATSTPLTIAIPGVIVSKRKKIPLVFEVRDLWPEIPIALNIINNPVLVFLSRRLEEWAYKNADKVIALSPTMRKGIVKNNPYKYVRTITNGSDTEVFFPDDSKLISFRKKYNIPLDVTLITYAGAFGLVNGVSYIVKLAEKFKENDKIFFLLIGNGSEREMVINLANKIGCLNKNLLWLDSLPKEKMPYVYAASDISFSTVIPVKQLEANSANKIFDSMASGCCIAINHQGWIKDMINE